MSSKIKSGLQNFAPRSKAKEVAPLCARRLSARRQRRLSARKPSPPRSILIKEIYLFGGSGGGHAALLATAYKPELWNTVISYVPIVDIRKWHAECKSRGLEFYKDIEACIGECTPDNYLYFVKSQRRLKRQQKTAPLSEARQNFQSDRFQMIYLFSLAGAESSSLFFSS